MGFLGFGGGTETHLVVVIFEGSGRLRLHGNKVKDNGKTKKNAASHGHAVCWAEFTPEGARQDGGLGVMSTRLGPGEADRLLKELSQLEACRTVLTDIRQGKDSSSKWLVWGQAAQPAPGGARR
jgi:hypothetical protein